MTFFYCGFIFFHKSKIHYICIWGFVLLFPCPKQKKATFLAQDICLSLCCSGGSSPLKMDSSSSDWEYGEDEGDYTSDEEPLKITKEDLLGDVLPANTILLQHGNASNLHRDLMEYYEDVWEDQDNRGSIGWNPCGVTCSSCDKIAYPNLEMIVLEETRYFLIFEESLPKVKCKENELEGFLQCVYCFNFYHRFGCTLSMSTQSYISCLLSRQWACPTCVPEFKSKLKLVNVESDCDWKLLIEVFQQLLTTVLDKSNECCCKYMVKQFLTNIISEEKFKYEFG